MEAREKVVVQEEKSESDRMFSGSPLFSESNQSNIKKSLFCNQEDHNHNHAVKTCRSNFHCFKCKGWQHVCICTFKNASDNQNSHDSKN